MTKDDRYHFVLQLPDHADHSFSLRASEPFGPTFKTLHTQHQKYLTFFFHDSLVKADDTPESIHAVYSPLGGILNETNVIQAHVIDQGYRVVKLMKRGTEAIIVKIDISTTLKELREVVDEHAVVYAQKLNYVGGKTLHDEELPIGEIGVNNDDVLVFHDGVQILSASEFLDAEATARQRVLERKHHEYELTITEYERSNIRQGRHLKKRKALAATLQQSLTPPKTPAPNSPSRRNMRIDTKVTHEDSIQSTPPPSSHSQHVPNSNNEYQCNHKLSNGSPCLKTFTRPYDLTRHQKHTHLRTTKLFCVICQDEDIYKEFGRLDSLRRHYRAKHFVKNEELGDLIQVSGID